MDTINIKKLHPEAIIPTRAHETDAGLDLYALEDVSLADGETKLVKTGIAIDIPPGYEGQVRPRSGLTLRGPLRVSLGTIDSGYNGDIGIISTCRLPNNGMWKGVELQLKKGQKIAQLVISPIVTPAVKVVDEFEEESARGDKGFGSSDEK